jgi:hypothetical protein
MAGLVPAILLRHHVAGAVQHRWDWVKEVVVSAGSPKVASSAMKSLHSVAEQS